MRRNCFVQHRAREIESEHDLTPPVYAFDARIQGRQRADICRLGPEENPVTGRETCAMLGGSAPTGSIETTQQGDFDACGDTVTIAQACQARADHLCNGTKPSAR